MMTEYLIRLYPLEPYTFGQETGFQFEKERGIGKQSYIMNSGEVPDQTALFGTTRYLILQASGLLKLDYQYTEEEKSKITQSIGERSFSFDTKPQTFGTLAGISPLFLMNEKGEILVTNPFHNKKGTNKKSSSSSPDSADNNRSFDPIRMEQHTALTSKGEIHLPVKGEFIAKEYHALGYFNLDTGFIEKDIFEHNYYTGIRKQHRDEDADDAFFKIDRVSIKKGYSFAYFARTESDLPEESIVYLGKRRNAFRAVCTIAEKSRVRGEEKLSEKIQKAFSSPDGTWYYAWSDLYIPDDKKQDPANRDFCMKEEKYLRNIQSSVRDGMSKVVRSEVRVNLIRRGSVFYRIPPQVNINGKESIIGLNRIIELK